MLLLECLNGATFSMDERGERLCDYLQWIDLYRKFFQKEQTITSMSAIDIGELQTKSYDYHTNEVINGSRWPNGAFKKIKISLPILTTQQSK